MAAQTNTLLPGYQTPIGNKQLVICDHTGPSSYSQTDMDVITASSLGLGGIDVIIADEDQTGTYYAEAIYTNTGGAQSSVKLEWFTNNGTQVTGTTDLSAKIIRLVIIGV